MDDIKTMLRSIINGQSSFRQEVLSKIDKLDTKLTNRIDDVEDNLKNLIKKVDKRVDNIGKQLAYLEDDAPTREEFDKLTGRVDKLEHKSASTL